MLAFLPTLPTLPKMGNMDDSAAASKSSGSPCASSYKMNKKAL